MLNPVANNLMDALIAEGTKKTTSGNYIFYFNEIKKDYKVDLKKEKKLLNEMITFARIHRDSIIADLEVYDECLDFNFYLQFCPNLEEGEYEYS